MKALLIESSPDVLESISLSLQLCWPQATLLSVAEGSKGIKLAQAESPDIVILDVDLPGTDGFDVLKQIRLFSGVPLMFLTSGDKMDEVRALETGADCCITKPLSAIEFLARVKALLRRAGAAEFKEVRFLRIGQRTVTGRGHRSLIASYSAK